MENGCESSAHHSVHPLGRGDREAGEDVLVALHHREGGVAENLHHDALGDAGGQEDRRRGVAQIVEAQALPLARAVRDPDLAADLAEWLSHVEGIVVRPSWRPRGPP